MSRSSLIVGLVALVLALSPLLAQAGPLLYFSAWEGSHPLSAVAADGTAISTFPGANGSSCEGGVACDSSGNLYATDNVNGTIEKMTSNGTITTFATGMGNAQGLAFDSSGNLYAAANYSSIYKITSDGTVSTFYTLPSGGPVTGLAFDKAGDLFLADCDSGMITELSSGGTVSTFATGMNGGLFGLAFDSSGNLYAAENSGTSVIYEFTPNGRITFASTGLVLPVGLAFDSSDNLYVANLGGTISEITPKGLVSTFATLKYAPAWIAFGPAPTPGPFTWAAAVPGTWSDSTKWTNGLIANADGAVAVISASATAAVTITLNEPVMLGSLVLGSGTSGLGYTLSGTGSNTLTLSNSSNNAAATISVIDGTHVIDAPVVLASNLVVTSTSSTPWTLDFDTASSITDSGNHLSLTMSASNGTLILSGSNTYTGGTIVTAGILDVTNPAALPDGSSLTIGAGATLIFDPSASGSPVTNSAAAAVPEPSTLVLLTVGILGLLGFWRKRLASLRV